MLPNPHDLEVFLTVVETLNFSRAAERVGLTQPALSLAIKRLENALGQDLFVRHKNGVRPTRAGSKMAVHARAMLDMWQALQEDAKRDQSEVRGRYSLGVHPSVALFTLKHFLPNLLLQYPELDFRLEHALSRHITDDVINHKLDFGLVVNPVPHPDLVIVELYKDEVGYWKLKKGKGSEEVLIFDPELGQAQEMLGKKSKMAFKRQVTSSSLEVIKSLCLAGAGVAILPKRVLGDELSLVENLGLPGVTDRHCLIYRVDRLQGEAPKALARAIADGIKKSK